MEWHELPYEVRKDLVAAVTNDWRAADRLLKWAWRTKLTQARAKDYVYPEAVALTNLKMTLTGERGRNTGRAIYEEAIRTLNLQPE